MDFLNLEFSKAGSKNNISIRAENIKKIRRESKQIIIEGNDLAVNFKLQTPDDAGKIYLRILDSLKKSDENFIKFICYD